MYSKIGLDYDFSKIHGGLVVIPSVASEKLSRWIEAHMRTFDPDIVFVGGWGTIHLRETFRIARRLGIPSVLENDTPVGHISRFSWKWLAHCLFVRRYVSAGFVPGALARRYLQSVGVKHVFTGLYSCDCEKVQSEGKGALGHSSRFTLLYVGRLAPEKNVSLFVKAFLRVRNKLGRDAQLIIVGAGPEEQRLKVEAGDVVVFAGMVQPDALEKYYASSSALVLPSTFEPWGMVVEEAYSHGLFAVLSRACGCVELMQNGICSFAFDPKSAQALESALLECYEVWKDPQRRQIGARVARSLVVPYDAPVWGLRIASILQRLGL
ncbi:MAG: glycosyltransferase [bacterium]